MSKLKGKVALVTGASKGIGAGIAKALAAAGASVVVNYASSKEHADKVVSDIIGDGGNAVAVRADVSKAADALALIDSTLSSFGDLDIVVNNSGIYEFAPLDEITEEAFHKSFNINVLGPLLVIKAAVKHLKAGASIINIGSTAPLMRSESTTVYTATKGALDSVTGVLAKELGPKNIRINSVNPGFTITEGTGSYVGSDFAEGLIKQVPLGRAAHPDDIASIVVFLASEDAKWLTGELINASGGLR
ncbi:SDR family NAD(P)-dependent oxidoreductase [Tunturiibacter psychrotolerans]|uniref:SDR family NAD(P)-dependent oxidoreductase n=1 Tax=Tunturiibacter psychrotolerans TaxID=3069686 RepID=UPI003D1EE37F